MIIFTEHALVKLGQRNIKRSLVIEALRNPSYVALSYGNRRINYKKFKRLYLSVVYRIEPRGTIVITAYWVEKVKNK